VFKPEYNKAQEAPEISPGDIISIMSNPYIVLEGTYLSKGIVTSIERGKHNDFNWCIVYIYSEIWVPACDESGELLQSPTTWTAVPCQIHVVRAYTKEEMIQWIRDGKVEIVFKAKQSQKIKKTKKSRKNEHKRRK